MGIPEPYWRAARHRVCVNCIDGDGHGNCRLSDVADCGLTVHFPRIVETVLSVRSDKLESYIHAVRQNVCAYCKHQSREGKCLLRIQSDCGLDRYFPLIVEVIEDVQLEVEQITNPFGE